MGSTEARRISMSKQRIFSCERTSFQVSFAECITAANEMQVRFLV